MEASLTRPGIGRPTEPAREAAGDLLKLPEGAPLAALDSDQTPWPEQPPKELGFHFDGYRLGSKRQPTFAYSWNGLKIEDFPRPVGEQDLFAMQRTLTIQCERPVANVWYRAIVANKIEELASGAYRIDDRWTLRAIARGNPLRRQQGQAWELLIPVVFQEANAKIELNYEW
jgi:hypothetical protein